MRSRRFADAPSTAPLRVPAFQHFRASEGCRPFARGIAIPHHPNRVPIPRDAEATAPGHRANDQARRQAA